MSKSKRGGKREGAGRPVIGAKDTSVIRVDAVLVPVVKAIKGHYSNNGTLDYIEAFRKVVTGNQSAATCLQDRAEANLELMKDLHSRTLAEQKELKLSLELAKRELNGRENRIDTLEIEIDGLKGDLKTITKLNKMQALEIEQLKTYGAPKAVTIIQTDNAIEKRIPVTGIQDESPSNTKTDRREKLGIQAVICELTGLGIVGAQKTITKISQKAQTALGVDVAKGNEQAIIEWLRANYTSPLRYKVVYQYEFSGGIAEIKTDGLIHWHREQLTGKSKFCAWSECQEPEIIINGTDFYISTSTGEHLLAAK